MNLKNLRIIRKLRNFYYFCKTNESHRNYNHGNGNIVKNEGLKVKNIIQFNGNNNKIYIEDGAVLKGTTISIIGSNCLVRLKKNSYVSDAEIFIEDMNCTVEVGANTFIGNRTHLACIEDNSSIIIGDDCLISAFCQIRTGDSHSLVDSSGKRLNPAASVMIGRHCWLGEGCKVLKGVCLCENTVISTGAIVTRSFGANCILAGVPVKVIKENINWDYRRL